MTEESRFFVDLSAKKVVCVSCRKLCNSLHLRDFTLFWCATRTCENSQEVRFFPGDVWEVYAFSENLCENSISEVTAQRIMAIKAESRISPKVDAGKM